MGRFRCPPGCVCRRVFLRFFLLFAAFCGILWLWLAVVVVVVVLLVLLCFWGCSLCLCAVCLFRFRVVSGSVRVLLLPCWLLFVVVLCGVPVFRLLRVFPLLSALSAAGVRFRSLSVLVVAVFVCGSRFVRVLLLLRSCVCSAVWFAVLRGALRVGSGCWLRSVVSVAVALRLCLCCPCRLRGLCCRFRCCAGVVVLLASPLCVLFAGVVPAFFFCRCGGVVLQ